MPCTKVRAKLGCHNCAYESADDCELKNIHLPSDSDFCHNCIRNPNPVKFPSKDNFITTKDLLSLMEPLL